MILRRRHVKWGYLPGNILQLSCGFWLWSPRLRVSLESSKASKSLKRIAEWLDGKVDDHFAWIALNLGWLVDIAAGQDLYQESPFAASFSALHVAAMQFEEQTRRRLSVLNRV